MAMKQDVMLAQAIGQLTESQRNLGNTLDRLGENMKTLNDHNILHQSQSSAAHGKILEKLQVMTAKYWWLIIGLIITILVVMGYKEAVKFLIV